MPLTGAFLKGKRRLIMRRSESILGHTAYFHIAIVSHYIVTLAAP